MKEQVTIFVWKFLFGLLFQTWTNFSKKIFSTDFISCFEWKYCAVSQNVIFMSFIYLHFYNCKFLTFCSIDWFRLQKPLATGPFQIPRYQDFWDKSLGWFLGFQCTARSAAFSRKGTAPLVTDNLRANLTPFQFFLTTLKLTLL